MQKKDTSIKAAWVAALAAVIVAMITQLPSIINLFKDKAPDKKSISIENIKDSSIVTGNNNSITNKND